MKLRAILIFSAGLTLMMTSTKKIKVSIYIFKANTNTKVSYKDTVKGNCLENANAFFGST